MADSTWPSLYEFLLSRQLRGPPRGVVLGAGLGVRQHLVGTAHPGELLGIAPPVGVLGQRQLSVGLGQCGGHVAVMALCFGYLPDTWKINENKLG